MHFPRGGSTAAGKDLHAAPGAAGRRAACCVRWRAHQESQVAAGRDVEYLHLHEFGEQGDLDARDQTHLHRQRDFTGRAMVIDAMTAYPLIHNAGKLMRQGSHASQSSTVMASGSALNKAVRYRYGSIPLTMQVRSSEYRLALALAPLTVSENKHLRLSMPKSRIALSHSSILAVTPHPSAVSLNSHLGAAQR